MDSSRRKQRLTFKRYDIPSNEHKRNCLGGKWKGLKNKKNGNPLKKKFNYKEKLDNRNNSNSLARRVSQLKNSINEVKTIQNAILINKEKMKDLEIKSNNSNFFQDSKQNSYLSRNNSKISQKNNSKNSSLSYYSYITNKPTTVRSSSTNTIFSQNHYMQGQKIFKSHYFPTTTTRRNSQSSIVQNPVRRVYFDSRVQNQGNNQKKTQKLPLKKKPPKKNNFSIQRKINPFLPIAPQNYISPVQREKSMPIKIRRVSRSGSYIKKKKSELQSYQESCKKSNLNLSGLKNSQKSSSFTSGGLYFYESSSKNFAQVVLDSENTNKFSQSNSGLVRKNFGNFDSGRKENITTRFSPASVSIAQRLKNDTGEKMVEKSKFLHQEISDNFFNFRLRKFHLTHICRKLGKMRKCAKIHKNHNIPFSFLEPGEKVNPSVKYKQPEIDIEDKPCFRDNRSQILKNFFCKEKAKIYDGERKSIMPNLIAKSPIGGEDIKNSLSKNYFSSSSDFSLLVIFQFFSIFNIFQFLIIF